MKPTHRDYFELNQFGPYPATPEIAYECALCGDVVSSAPSEAASCRCGNIVVDPVSGCVALRELTAVKPFYTRS